MSDDGQTQSGYEDGAAGGPGAPSPLAALEVWTSWVANISTLLTTSRAFPDSRSVTFNSLSMQVTILWRVLPIREQRTSIAIEVCADAAIAPRRHSRLSRVFQNRRPPKFSQKVCENCSSKTMHILTVPQLRSSCRWASPPPQRCTSDDPNSYPSPQARSNSTLSWQAVSRQEASQSSSANSEPEKAKFVTPWQ